MQYSKRRNSKDVLKRICIPENSGEDNVIIITDSKMDHKCEVCGKREKNELTSKRHMENEHDSERNTCKTGKILTPGSFDLYNSTILVY